MINCRKSSRVLFDKLHNKPLKSVKEIKLTLKHAHAEEVVALKINEESLTIRKQTTYNKVTKSGIRKN